MIRFGAALLALLCGAAGCALAPQAPGPASDSEASAAATATNARAIVGGSASAGDAAVVAIGQRRSTCEARLVASCSGSLIAPRLVLTAAHCVLDPRLSNALEVYFGGDTETDTAADPEAALREVVHVAAHPDYAGAGDAADLAVLVLAREAPVAPLRVDAGALDSSWEGRRVRLLGFGQSYSSDPRTGVKRSGTAVITAVGSVDFRVEPDPAMSCHGDSGGPVLAERDGVEVLIGVSARGDPGCQLYGDNVRVDGFRDSFLAEWIAAAATWPAPAEVSAEDLRARGEALCTGACASDAECPAGLRCLPSIGDGVGPSLRCTLPGFTAGVFGDACSSDAACDDRCARVRGDDSADACLCYRSCTAPPTGDAGGGCRVAPGAGPGGSGGFGGSGSPVLWLSVLLLTLVCRVRGRLRCLTLPNALRVGWASSHSERGSNTDVSKHVELRIDRNDERHAGAGAGRLRRW